MNIQEQIQILEDNLNEYGQCNITIEEYNYLQDELYSSGCLAGIELGEKDAIDEFKNFIRNNKHYFVGDMAEMLIYEFEQMQLKEQK